MMASWDVYVCRINDKLAAVALDLDLISESLQQGRPVCIKVRHPLRGIGPDGLPDGSEQDQLARTEEAVRSALVSACGAIYAGRISSDGHRILFFYASSDVGARDALRATEASRAHPVQIMTKADPSWDTYRELLYPDPRTLQRMLDAKVVERLAELGDVAAKPRFVEHRAYFSTPEQRSSFKEAAAFRLRGVCSRV